MILMFKYYSCLRPVSIGTYPKAGLVEFKNYDRRKFVDEIQWEAWGELWYDRPLTDAEVYGYDFMPSLWNEYCETETAVV